jgi:hypothetical protein
VVPDPTEGFEVLWGEEARAQAEWLNEQGIDLFGPVNRTLEIGPEPHPYRRIRVDGDAMRLAVKDWRVRFRAEGRRVTVLRVTTGYRPRELEPSGKAPAVHRAFCLRFAGS